MKIFLSYASEDRDIAEQIQLALSGDGHAVFFDRQSLPGGGDYNARIRSAVADCDVFVYLVSPDSIDHGGYALTELGYARERWPHPAERMLPVLVRKTPFEAVPLYARSVSLFEPSGNVPAEVAARVAKMRALAPRWRRLGLAAAALAIVASASAAAWWTLRTPPEQKREAALPKLLQFRFNFERGAATQVALEDTLKIVLQSTQRVVNGERLAQQSGGFYSHNDAFPGAGEKLVGALVREVRDTSKASAPPPARFCLKRPSPLQPSTEFYVHLDCKEGATCARHFPSPGWLETCPLEPLTTLRSFGLIGTAHAADEAPRWTVPSARTLEAHQAERRGVGYTLFRIETAAFRDPAVIGVEVEVRANGVAIDEDGMPAALRPVPNDAGRPFVHTFAIESLDLAGAQAGCDVIELALRPLLAGGKGRGPALRATLPYVALRDAPGTSVALGAATLGWSARYVVPPAEWSHEAFFTSVAYPVAGGAAASATARAKTIALKQAFDALKLSFVGRPIVAVIRPPLTQTDTFSYGLAAGTVQPSGQVRFTFSAAEAGALGDALLAARASGPAAARVFDRGQYIYRVGTRQRQELPTPAGVCAHVKA